MPIIKRLLQVKKKYFLLTAVLWLLIVTLACLVPVGVVRDVEPAFGISDKIAHGVFYFVSTLLFFLYFYKSELKNALIKVSLFSMVYGIIIEGLQYEMAYGRSADIGDVLANGIGILTAIVLVKFVLLKKVKN